MEDEILHPLEVRTYTGDIRPYLEPGKVPWNRWIAWDRFPHSENNSGVVVLVACSRIMEDQTVFEFYDDSIGDFLRRAHEEMVVLAKFCREAWKLFHKF